MSDKPKDYYRDTLHAVKQFIRVMATHTPPELDGPGEAFVAVLDDFVRRLELRLGSIKLEIASTHDAPKDIAVEGYPSSLISELYDAGVSYSKAVARAYVYFDAIQAIDPSKDRDGLNKLLEKELREHIEVAYYRAAAFWDRIGQLLEFVFFNVRDYRDGFSATIQRMKANFDLLNLPHPPLSDCPDWLFLRNFEKKEHQDLTSKRNVLAHRRSFREFEVRKIQPAAEQKIRFVPLIDHLDTAGHKFGSVPGELSYLCNHAQTIWKGIAAALEVSLWWVEKRRH